jgi:transcriptional regulator with XRE-family HTH domain
MNFNKIKNICEQKGLTIPQLAEKIDLSEAGLYQSFRNQSMKVDILEKISTALEVPIWVFFDLNPESAIAPLKKENEELRGNLVILETTKAYLEKEVKDLIEMVHILKQLNQSLEKINANNEEMVRNYEKIMDGNKLLHKFSDAIQTIEDIAKGKLKIGSPEFMKATSFDPKDFNIPDKGRKGKK